jgi:hypothetical protein
MGTDKITDQNATQGITLDTVLKTCGKRLGDCTFSELQAERELMKKLSEIESQAVKVCKLELKYREALADNPGASHAKVDRAVKKYNRMRTDLGITIDDAELKAYLDPFPRCENDTR